MLAPMSSGCIWALGDEKQKTMLLKYIHQLMLTLRSLTLSMLSASIQPNLPPHTLRILLALLRMRQMRLQWRTKREIPFHKRGRRENDDELKIEI